MAAKLGGVFTALLTPFATDGSVDYKALKKLVRFNLDKGVPVIIYNFVSAGGAKLSTDNFKDFFSDERFIGVKHTSSDFFMLERLKAFRKLTSEEEEILISVYKENV